jgi:hypothetical protein
LLGRKKKKKKKMQEASSSSSLPALSSAYQPLPSLYLGFLAIWAASGLSWAFSSWRNRHFQVCQILPVNLRLFFFFLKLCKC